MAERDFFPVTARDGGEIPRGGVGGGFCFAPDFRLLPARGEAEGLPDGGEKPPGGSGADGGVPGTGRKFCGLGFGGCDRYTICTFLGEMMAYVRPLAGRPTEADNRGG